MPESSHERSLKSLGKKKRFLKEHPYCCFCGGAKPSTTIDHVPPKACFPDGYWPEGFEFPACEACNQGSKNDDQIVGFYTQMADFSKANLTPQDHAKRIKLGKAILRKYPDLLSNFSSMTPVRRVGPIITPTPIAFSLEVPPAFTQAMETMERKLTHALYYREIGRPLTKSHAYMSSYYQIQGNNGILTEFLNGLLPEERIGSRTNIKSYGERFGYKCGYNENEDLFMFGAQFGNGLIVWGMVLGPGTISNPLRGPLKTEPWWQGGTALKVRVLLDAAPHEAHS